MQEITYSFSRIEAKEATITDIHCDAGNICSLVVGMTATSGGYSAYIDGVTGHMNYTPQEFSGVISEIANTFASGRNFKQSLRNQIISKIETPVAASDFVLPPINVN